MICHQYDATIMYHCSKISTSSPSSRDWENCRHRTSLLFYVVLQAVRVRLMVTPPGGPKRKMNSSSNPETMRPKKQRRNSARTTHELAIWQELFKMSTDRCILLLRLVWLLQVLEDQATVGSEEGGEHKGLHGHELDEDVEGWARGVLQGVTDGVADNGSLVAV